MTEAAKEARRKAERKWYAEHREERRAYAKEWRRRNPDKVRQAQERYWTRKAAEHDKI